MTLKLSRVSIAAIAAALAAPAYAQTAGAPVPTDNGGIQDIVVTAQKRAENVQNVPIAISAFTANALQERQVTSVAQLSNIAPNVTLDAGTPFSGSSAVLSAYIRGIGANDFAFNIDPGVGVYLDGVYLARSVGANQDLPDVERIEVLKGPQGTLFGRNTIGGAISIVTHDPGKDFAFRGDVTTGSYRLIQVRGDGFEARGHGSREAARLRADGLNARAAAFDVTDRDAARAVFDGHVAAYGGLDICFANAGVDAGAGFWSPGGGRNPEGQLDTYDPARWDLSIGVNLTGVFNTVREAVRCMKAAGRGGSIIATSSNAAIVCEPIVGIPYMAAKSGVMHFVRHAALELAEFGIRVNAIAPGPFVTNIGGGWLKKDPQARKAWDALVPVGRVAETYQIKPLALLLASDASSYMTGSHVLIDGGMALGKFK